MLGVDFMAKIFSILTIICILVYFSIMIYLHSKHKEYNPIYHAVSDYGVGSSKRFYAISGYVSAIGSLSLAIALYFWSYDFSFKTTAIILLLVRVISVVGVIIFPTDIEGMEKTKNGKIHLLLAVVQFTAIAIFVFNMTERLQPILNQGFSAFLGALEYVVKFGLITLVAAMVIRKLKKYFGLFERVFLYSSAFYILICSIIILMK